MATIKPNIKSFYAAPGVICSFSLFFTVHTTAPDLTLVTHRFI